MSVTVSFAVNLHHTYSSTLHFC